MVYGITFVIRKAGAEAGASAIGTITSVCYICGQMMMMTTMRMTMTMMIMMMAGLR